MYNRMRMSYAELKAPNRKGSAEKPPERYQGPCDVNGNSNPFETTVRAFSGNVQAATKPGVKLQYEAGREILGGLGNAALSVAKGVASVATSQEAGKISQHALAEMALHHGTHKATTHQAVQGAAAKLAGDMAHTTLHAAARLVGPLAMTALELGKTGIKKGLTLGKTAGIVANNAVSAVVGAGAAAGCTAAVTYFSGGTMLPGAAPLCLQAGILTASTTHTILQGSAERLAQAVDGSTKKPSSTVASKGSSAPKA